MGVIADLLLRYPAGLWGLAAIAVPVILHLVNLSRGKRVLVGNIALFRAARRHRASEIRLEQWLLLLLRILILVIAALILAGLALPGLDDEPRDTVYVTPGAMAETPGTTTGEPKSDDAVYRLLVPGYPLLDGNAAVAPADDHYDAWPLLAERLETVNHTGKVDIVLDGRAGELGVRAPTLTGQPGWSTTATRAETDGTHAGMADARPGQAPMRVVVIHDGGQAEWLARIEAALAVLQRHRLPGLSWVIRAVQGNPVALTTSAGENGTDDTVRWLWLAPSTPALPKDAGPVSIARAEQWPVAADDPGFPQSLLEALLLPEETASAYHHAAVDLSVLPEITSADSGDDGHLGAQHRPYRSLQPWLALLLVALWAIERWLSERRRG